MGQQLLDISRTISPDMVTYPGDPAIVTDYHIKGPFQLTSLEGFTVHTGTHLDAPRHIRADGASLDQFPLERFLLPAVVVEVPDVVDIVDVEHLPESAKHHAVLFKTRNSVLPDTGPFVEDHAYISAAAAEALAAQDISLVGFDYLSVDRHGDSDFPAHRSLLEADKLILEGLQFRDVGAGYYWLLAAPLRIAGADGSPVRAVLMGP